MTGIKEKDPHDELEAAKRRLEEAEAAVRVANQKLKDQELALLEGLPVGKNCPCKVGVLPNGKVVVHVWVESSSKQNQLHIVEPFYITGNGKPRDKFPGELLGAGFDM